MWLTIAALVLAGEATAQVLHPYTVVGDAIPASLRNPEMPRKAGR